MENHCATCGTVLVEKKLFPLPSLNISFMLYNLCLLCFTLQPYTTTKGPGSIFCCPWVLGSCCRVHPEATWRKLQAEQALLLQPHQSLWPSWQSLLTLSSSWSLLILPTPLGPPAGLFDRAALQSGNPPHLLPVCARAGTVIIKFLKIFAAHSFSPSRCLQVAALPSSRRYFSSLLSPLTEPPADWWIF